MITQLRLVVGEQAELTLPGLGTAGYRWSETIDGDAEAVTVQWQRGFSADEAKPRLAGAGAPERLMLTAIAPGRLNVRLEQRRPWESGPPKAERVVEVEVRAPDPGGQ